MIIYSEDTCKYSYIVTSLFFRFQMLFCMVLFMSLIDLELFQFPKCENNEPSFSIACKIKIDMY